MSARESIYIDGFQHKNPVPHACRVGNTLMSGVIAGPDPETGLYAASVSQQCARMFGNVRLILAKAGFDAGDIIKMTFWLRDTSDRDALNAEWLAMFGDPASRPAREVLKKGDEGNAAIICDIVAIRG